jgi:hypothetical protein
MRALVVYESMYGNTRAVAVDIAAGLRATHEVTLVPVTRVTRELVATADLIVAGSPTHMHGMPTVASRRMAAETARKQGSGLNLDPDADGPGSPCSRAAPAGAFRGCWAGTAAACWSQRKASSSASRTRWSRERPNEPARGEHWSARPHAWPASLPSSYDLRKGGKDVQERSARGRSSQAGGPQVHRSLGPVEGLLLPGAANRESHHAADSEPSTPGGPVAVRAPLPRIAHGTAGGRGERGRPHHDDRAPAGRARRGARVGHCD